MWAERNIHHEEVGIDWQYYAVSVSLRLYARAESAGLFLVSATRAVSGRGGEVVLNHVTLIGKVSDAGPKLSYADNGQPECRWTLAIEEPGAGGKLFTTYIPCSAWGKSAEAIADQVEAGDLICIRDGRLKFRKTVVKGESVSKLEVSCWQVTVVQRSTVAEPTTTP